MERITLEQMPLVRSENLRHLVRYVNFINSRPERKLKQKTFHTHHIYPKSIAKKNGITNYNSSWNLIDLTPREHFIAHMILYYCGYEEMIRAFLFMSYDKEYKTYFKLNSKQFEILKLNDNNLQSLNMSGRKVITNGLNKKHIKVNENIPEGWRFGNPDKYHMPRIGFSWKNKLTESEITEVSNKISKSNTGKIRTQEQKDCYRLSKLGNKNPNYNVLMSEENKKLLSERQSGDKSFFWKNPVCKDTTWYTNGTDHIRLKNDESIPDGFYKGLGFSTKGNKGKKQYNNGYNLLYLDSNDIVPEGYVAGSFKKGDEGYKPRKSGFIIINNGFITLQINKNDRIPDGFIKGRIKTENKDTAAYSSAAKNRMWITDGVINKSINKNLEIPKGFRNGITRKIHLLTLY